ncbi:amidohydrolase family protein [Actinomadura sp. NEAU-AAG7]|uniref:amidohydrolase family protein n=1 Tax=Actinomadura sp. NEAU-AAG7 TaxID=2839640 RepID=UPI001BE3F2C9|nr:amidohydrolase family protein [Actinomadura sp. NEAU-AAG7]MBT2208080.1 amidohydrolase family protein [Actinomadura sp. NEAU-AAG7]
MESSVSRRSALVLTGAAVGGVAAGRPREHADLVLHSGTVWTGNGTARAVAVKGMRIVAVGSDEHVLEWAGDRTRRVDLRGAFVGPGFRDQHTHLIQTALTGAGAETYRPVWKPYDEGEAFESRRRNGKRHLEIHARGETPVDNRTRSPVTEKMKNDLLVMQEEVARQVLDPLWGLQRVVTRTEFDGTPPGGWMPEQRLDVPAALRLITSKAAFASYEERQRGTVSPGRYADLVVLKENPLTVPPERIAAATRLMTVTNGKITSEGPVRYPPTA